MSWNLGYLLINAMMIPGWAMLILLPRDRLTAKLVHSMLYPALMGSIYFTALIAGVFFGQSAQGAGFGSVDAVMAAFDHPNGVVIGWTHYLVFDLFVGAWIGRDAIRNRLPHAAIIPCFLATFIFGPLGLLAYLLLRFMLRKNLSLDERLLG